jgi:hypothetical protein
MKQYYPAIKTIDQLEDTINLPAIYRIIDVAAGIYFPSHKPAAPDAG